MESPLPGDRHGGFGERPGETDRKQSRHRAPGRLNHAIIITPAVCAAPALILGIRVLLRPGPEHGLRRRIMASIGIALALLGSIALFAVLNA